MRYRLMRDTDSKPINSLKMKRRTVLRKSKKDYAICGTKTILTCMLLFWILIVQTYAF